MTRARYFFWVGGALLALLIIADSFLPKLPVVERADTPLPGIHIRSDQKWPERIVYDTSHPIIPARPESAEADARTMTAAADISTKSREAFAQLQRSDANQLQQSSDQKKREAKLQHQRKIAKRKAAPPTRLVARQPQFGWFGTGIW
jgi:hypothetical protein